MNGMYRILLIGSVLLSAACYADTLTAPAPGRVLFVYDKLDKESRFHIEAFKAHLTEAGCDFDEAAVEKKPVNDPAPYRSLVVYSRVMAFDLKSPVRGWLKKQKSFAGKSVFLYVTANKWLHEKHLKGLEKIVEQRGGQVADAVTMATGKMSDPQKRAAIREQCTKVKQQ